MWILIIVCALLATAVILLTVKVVLMRSAFDEIDRQVQDRLSGENSSSFRLTTTDSKAQSLANSLDSSLTQLNEERVRLMTGDREMRSNITAISHDIRTPLTAISSYADLLDSSITGDEPKEYITRIKDRCDELKDMTSELFKYSVSKDSQYYSGLSVEPVDIRRAVEDSLLSFYKAFESHGITVEPDLCEDSIVLSLNRKTVMRVLDNIFSNASKYADGILKVSLASGGLITVSNHAPSLTPLQVSHMFDKYYTVSDGTASTGLGLSIAKDLVSLSGGSISAELTDGMLIIKVMFATKTYQRDGSQ